MNLDCFSDPLQGGRANFDDETARELYVCQCCHTLAQTGDESGCRDYWHHGAETHPRPSEIPFDHVHDEAEDIRSVLYGDEYTCDACGGSIDALASLFAYRSPESIAEDDKATADQWDRRSFWDGYRAALVCTAMANEPEECGGNGDALTAVTNLDDDEVWSMVDPATRARVIRECLDFIGLIGREIRATDWKHYTRAVQGDPWEMAGRDFCLTRGGHGTGFWDRGAGTVGDRLSELAKSYADGAMVADLTGAIGAPGTAVAAVWVN